MYAVLYTHQLEPITVVDLPMHVWDMLERGLKIRIEMMEPLRLKPYDACDLRGMNTKVVTIHGEKIRRGGHSALMLFTDDEETALLLQAAFLPGQLGELRRRRDDAYAQGFLDALLSYRA